MKKLFNTQVLLWLALLLALLGSLRHVAWGFSTLEQGNIGWGLVQAVAVDLGLFALAIGIQQRRRQERGTRWLWVGVVLFSAISTYANLLHGLVFSSTVEVDEWGNLGRWMVIAKPFLLSGVLPLMVVYMAEIVASNLHYQQTTQPPTPSPQPPALPDHILIDGLIRKWHESYNREPTVPQLIYEFSHATGRTLTTDQADAAILEWRSANGIRGRRPGERQAVANEVSPNGHTVRED